KNHRMNGDTIAEILHPTVHEPPCEWCCQDHRHTNEFCKIADQQHKDIWKTSTQYFAHTQFFLFLIERKQRHREQTRTCNHDGNDCKGTEDITRALLGCILRVQA